MEVGIVKLYRGKVGLASTFWFWGIIGTVIASIIAYGSVFLTRSGALFLVLMFAVWVWKIFISFCIINAASYKRDRGFWGWFASILAGSYIIVTVFQILAA